MGRILVVVVSVTLSVLAGVRAADGAAAAHGARRGLKGGALWGNRGGGGGRVPPRGWGLFRRLPHGRGGRARGPAPSARPAGRTRENVVPSRSRLSTMISVSSRWA